MRSMGHKSVGREAVGHVVNESRLNGSCGQ